MLITDKTKLSAFNTENRLWQGIPGIEVTSGGRIFSTFYSGGTKEAIGNYSVLVKSDDGINFSEPVAAAYAGESYRCYDQCLWIDPLGRLWFIWSRMPEHAVFAAICNNPDADELVWGEEFQIGSDVMMNKPTVLSDGEWLFPIAVWNHGVRVLDTVRDTDPVPRGSFVYKTVDNGKTFENIGGADVPDRSFDEHMVLELSDGTLAMYVRTNYGIGVSYSYDKGKTWTKGVDSGLGGPCSRFFIRRLKSGRVLLVNHVNFTGRNNLTALLSEDDGKTWKYSLLLDGRSDVSYPDGVEASDGYIYITYDRERGGFKKSIDEVYADAREILYCKITEEDIIAGKLKDSGSKLGVIISKLGKYSGRDSDKILGEFLPRISFLDGLDVKCLAFRDDIPMYDVTMPDEDYGFLHEAAIIAFKDKLFAAWYNNEKLELSGKTPIRFATSDDGGKTWSEPITVAVDETAKILYCPPIFAVEDGKLYMFLNQMVKADHMHSFDLYIYNEEKNQFEELWSRPIPFKLNTNVYKLPDGKLILPGRISHELDTFPNTPAVMISDSGKVDADWRLVKLQENGNLPDGSKYIHPELTFVVCNEKIYGFCRNDERDVPVVYVSEDLGESRSQLYVHDIPLSPSKIYSGTLSDGRNYVIGNVHYNAADRYKRDKLAIFFSKKGEMKFDKGFLLQDGKTEATKFSGTWHYPCCYEHDGKLYVIYSANTGDGSKRGAVVSVIDISEI